MRMSVKQLRAFLAVAHTLNFAHASERLNLSQPALSLTIKGLEEALGGALLQRSTRKVTLTQEGELFLPMARQLLADWDNVEEAMRQSFTLQRGKISVAAMPSFAANVLPEALKAFRDRYAGVNVTVHDVINEQVIEMVREGRVEMGIAFEPSPNHNLLFTPLAVDRFVAIVPQQSPLAKKKQLSWQELLTLDFITLQRPSAVRLMLEEALARSGRQLDVALESHQLVTVGRMVASGLGGSAVPALCKTQMASLGAVCIPLSDPPIEKDPCRTSAAVEGGAGAAGYAERVFTHLRCGRQKKTGLLAGLTIRFCRRRRSRRRQRSPGLFCPLLPDAPRCALPLHPGR